MWNACFCSLKINLEIMFFQDAFLDTLFDDLLEPLKIQWARKSNPKSTKWRPKPSCVIFGRSISSSPDFFYILVALWLSVGTLWVPIDYLLLHFRYRVQWFSMFLAQTFESTLAKQAAHPPIKLIQNFCQDRPTSVKIANGSEYYLTKQIRDNHPLD